MPRFLPAVAAAVLLVTAGCAGVLTEPTADVSATTDPTDRTVSDGGSPDAEPADVAPGSTVPGTSIVTYRRVPNGGSAAGLPEIGQAVPSVASTTLYGSQSAIGGPGTIAVSANGQTSAPPDIALVHLAVEARAGTAEEARAQVATDVASMREAIRELGIPDDAVRTTYYHLSPEYDHTEGGRMLVGYVATHGFEITAGVDRAGAVVDAAVGNGADRVTGVQFTLTDASERALRAEALAEAMGAARSDADAIAAAGNVTITGLSSVSTGGPTVLPYAGRVAEAAGGVTTFEPGPVTVTASVTVVYSIE